MVTDVAETVEFYEDVLGFEVVMAVSETEDEIRTDCRGDDGVVYAQMKNGGVEIMVQKSESLKDDVPAFADASVGGSVCLYIETENVDEFYDETKADVEVVTAPTTAWYGMREYYIRDNNGYVLGFAE
ncbi:VOC family protein [Natrarchaeobius sp. A-rgal3]|uniref:VOC family protein n=1 Tax=Natrarchaeobius versutus TaxID=1679078 RepID=UPI0035102A02